MHMTKFPMAIISLGLILQGCAEVSKPEAMASSMIRLDSTRGATRTCYNKVGIRDGQELRTVFYPICIDYTERTIPVPPGRNPLYVLNWVMRVGQTASTRKAGYSGNNGGRQERMDISFDQIFQDKEHPGLNLDPIHLGNLSRSCYAFNYQPITGQTSPSEVSILAVAGPVATLNIHSTDWERCAGPNDLPESEAN